MTENKIGSYHLKLRTETGEHMQAMLTKPHTDRELLSVEKITAFSAGLSARSVH